MEFRRIHHRIVDSTSERAFAALAEGSARHGDVHVAIGQTAGRGRRGASWLSPAGEGLYLSVILLPEPPGLHPAGLTMAAGLAVRAAVARLGLQGALLKWPNDVVVRGAKLAGILVETRGLDPARPHFVVGIGVNVSQRGFPPELLAERAVTSLLLEGREVSTEAVCAALLEELAPRLEDLRAGAETLARDFLAATGLAGRRVRVQVAAQELAGVLRGLSLSQGIALEVAGVGLERLALEHVRSLRELP